ncbi:trihelix transcription factor ENAP2-like [Rutidosis leptorrhynchoides]|uniref:trihelix transcription factor ENAP2-like n=1 Tax=Rutidosis leptorrhynchoides TaxID=125765 RepID=UPI003A991F9E
MDETDDGSRYISNYGMRPQVSVRNVVNHHSQSQQIADSYINDDDEVEEDEQQQGFDNGMSGIIEPNNNDVENEKDADDDDTDNDDDGENRTGSENFNLHRHPKKRKLDSLLSSFELVPRVPPPLPLSVVPSVSKRTSFGGRNTLTDWSEHETFALLDAWGSRFVQRGRKSLRLEEWQEVAESVSKVSKMERTDTQCRNRLDTLKKKYKKEKALLEGGTKSTNTKWVYFKKMDMLISSTPAPMRALKSAGPLSGVDSGEFDSMKPNVYLDSANGLDKTRDSVGETDTDDDFDLVPLTRSKNKRVEDGVIGGSFRLLADSLNKFSDIYEKIETRKRKQMMELEKMRMDFHKDLELQKKQILERAKDEILKIRQGNYEDIDSAENISG